MNIIEKTTTVHAAIEGSDFKGSVHIVNNKIERLELSLHTKATTQEVVLENEEQARSLVQELSRVLSYIDTERNLGIPDVEFEED